MKPIEPSVKALTKKQLSENIKNRSFPQFVIQAFNECIEESKLKKSNTVLQKTVVSRIMKLGKVSSKEIFENNWLDVEDFYRKAGWAVRYDKPAFNETYEPYFEFT